MKRDGHNSHPATLLSAKVHQQCISGQIIDLINLSGHSGECVGGSLCICNE